MTADTVAQDAGRLRLRPEARPVPFGDLDVQQRDAFLEMVDLLFGAAESVTTTGPGNLGPAGAAGGSHLPTRSLLVDGGRGTGKTTLLLTLAEALKADPYGVAPGERFDLARLPEWAAQRLRALRNRLFWLETLDMEPLSDDVNLLGAMLARLEEALGGPALDEPASASLLSSGTDYQEAARALARLQTSVTRAFPGRAGSRADSSDPDTYAVTSRGEERDRLHLGRSFRAVLSQVSMALHGRRHLHTPVFVLPVDDLDLNVGKSLALLRLLRVVQSPHLVVIMAADLRLLSSILRLQYQGELAQIAGPVGLTANDRQLAHDLAADVLRKHLPSAQRVRLAAADPAWALDYRPHPGAARLRDLLGKISLPTDHACLTLDSRFWPRDDAPTEGTRPDPGRASAGAPLPADRRIRANVDGYSWPEALRVPTRRVVDFYLRCHCGQRQQPGTPSGDALRRYSRDRLEEWRKGLPPGRDETDFAVRADTDRPPPQVSSFPRVVSRSWTGWAVDNDKVPLPSAESAALVGCYELAGPWDRPWLLKPYLPPLRESHLPVPSGGEPLVLGWPWVSHSTFWGYERAVKWLRKAESTWAGQPYHLFGAWIAVMTAQLFDVTADQDRLLDEPARPVAEDWPGLRTRLDELPDTDPAREWHLAVGLLCTPEMGMAHPGLLPVPVIPPDLAEELDRLRAARGFLDTSIGSRSTLPERASKPGGPGERSGEPGNRSGEPDECR